MTYTIIICWGGDIMNYQEKINLLKQRIILELGQNEEQSEKMAKILLASGNKIEDIIDRLQGVQIEMHKKPHVDLLKLVREGMGKPVLKMEERRDTSGLFNNRRKSLPAIVGNMQFILGLEKEKATQLAEKMICYKEPKEILGVISKFRNVPPDKIMEKYREIFFKQAKEGNENDDIHAES
jgi:hypothetical protein